MIEPDDERHGSERGYSAGCRQFCCKRAHAEFNAIRKQIRIARGIPEHAHGTTNGYSNYDCRCDACMIASLKGRSTRG